MLHVASQPIIQSQTRQQSLSAVMLAHSSAAYASSGSMVFVFQQVTVDVEVSVPEVVEVSVVVARVVVMSVVVV
jgi:hypothetical protein